ncbi:MAG: patatin family protein [Bacteroidota bacterium]
MTCLIVEGGGFKTGFTSGVLDAFQAANYRDFDMYLGVSGGSITTSYFLSQQYRQCLRAIRLLAEDKMFMQFTRTFGAEGYMNIDYLKSVAEQKVPLDLDLAIAAAKKAQVYFVATNRTNGQAAYLQPNRESWLDILIASSTLPFVTKGKHNIHGVEYFDGGWSDPLPAKWAYEQGAKRILVIRTNPAERKSTQSLADYFGSYFYNDNQHLRAAFANCHLFYNEAVEFILSPPDDLIIEQISPIKDLKSTTYTYTSKTIMSDYRYGLDQGIQYVQKVREN